MKYLPKIHNKRYVFYYCLYKILKSKSNSNANKISLTNTDHLITIRIFSFAIGLISVLTCLHKNISVCKIN